MRLHHANREERSDLTLAISCSVSGLYGLGPGQNWFFWFYPRGGAFASAPAIDKDKTVLHLVVRPYSPDSWDVAVNGLIVVLEGAYPNFRHSYRLNVKNTSNLHQMFYIAVSEIAP